MQLWDSGSRQGKVPAVHSSPKTCCRCIEGREIYLALSSSPPSSLALKGLSLLSAGSAQSLSFFLLLFLFLYPPTPPHPTFPSPPSRPFLLSLLSLLSLHLSGELLAWEPHLCPVVSSGHLSVGSVRCLGPPLVTKQGLVVISSPSRPPPLPSRYVTAARSFRSGCLPRTHLFQVTESPRREF